MGFQEQAMMEQNGWKKNRNRRKYDGRKLTAYMYEELQKTTEKWVKNKQKIIKIHLIFHHFLT